MQVKKNGSGSKPAEFSLQHSTMPCLKAAEKVSRLTWCSLITTRSAWCAKLAERL
jgi:hypothetical protein